MVNTTYKILMRHETYGEVLNEIFSDNVQFKIFLKMVQGCIELKQDLSFFNGTDFLVHIPFKHLVECIITTSNVEYTLTDHFRSKIESEVS
jgi:hypothetical protein